MGYILHDDGTFTKHNHKRSKKFDKKKYKHLRKIRKK